MNFKRYLPVLAVVFIGAALGDALDWLVGYQLPGGFFARLTHKSYYFAFGTALVYFLKHNRSQMKKPGVPALLSLLGVLLLGSILGILVDTALDYQVYGTLARIVHRAYYVANGMVLAIAFHRALEMRAKKPSLT